LAIKYDMVGESHEIQTYAGSGRLKGFEPGTPTNIVKTEPPSFDGLAPA